jgi:ATP/maltotriose-dependent transcriptional regulator MalT
VTRSLASCYGYDVVTMQEHQAYNAAGLDHARRANSVVDELSLLGSLGWGAVDMGQYAEAERYFHEAKGMSTALISPHMISFVTCGLAYVHFAQGKMETAGRLAEEATSLAQEFNVAERAGLGLLIRSLVATIAADYTRALQLAQQGMVIGVGRYFLSYGDWALALIHLGLNNVELAWRHLRVCHRSVQVPASIPRMLVVAAVLLGRQGQHERAAELLGAVVHDRHSAHGWMEQWQPLSELRGQLTTALGAHAYQEWLDRGARLNAEQTADELLGLPPEAGDAGETGRAGEIA